MPVKPLLSAMMIGALAVGMSACGGYSKPSKSPSSGYSSPAPSPHGSSAPKRAQGFTAQTKQVDRKTVPYSWRPGCPVPLSRLRLIEMSFWGMDKKPHQGQMIVNASAANKIIKTFRKLFDSRYPIRRMQLVDTYKGSDFQSIEADNTSAFNCRKATGSDNWSQHSLGLAVDINPCENPFVSADGRVAHRKCVKFKNRSLEAPGVIHRNDKVVKAFAAVGWGWGGSWSGIKDYQHFSASGR